jgi:flagellar motor switch/type III secretory pathway protein FliN
MQAGDHWAGARPLTVDMLRAKMPEAENQFKNFSEAVDLVPQLVGETLQGINTTVVRCSLASIGFRNLVPDLQAIGAFHFLATKGRLRFWFQADRQFDTMLCELAFGGAGIEAGEEENNRPQTNIEKGLLQLFHELLSVRLADAVGDLQDSHFLPLDILENPVRKSELSDEICVELTILVNAFAHAAEFRVLLSHGDLTALFPAAPELVQADRTKAVTAMARCQFNLAVYFEPVQIPLDEFLSLDRGAVFALGATPHSPIHIRCGDEVISHGLFRLKEQSVEIELTEFGVEH